MQKKDGSDPFAGKLAGQVMEKWYGKIEVK
jgi:hypothetical protein